MFDRRNFKDKTYKKDGVFVYETLDQNTRYYVKYDISAHNKVDVSYYTTYNLTDYRLINNPSPLLTDSLKKIFTIHRMQERLTINLINDKS